MKKWKICTAEKEKISNILMRTDLNSLCAEILVARGISELEQLQRFFSEEELGDPFELADMEKAVEAVRDAIESGELICVYGDYDCDGVTSTAVMYSYLENVGGNVTYYIPEREDGYGLNESAVRKLHEEGVSMIITVDNGISAHAEAKLIAELGMKLVITDHHQPSETLPEAIAVVDPHRKDDPSEFKDLCGVGVVLKLCSALDDGSYEMVLEQYADISAIGTIADIVPLVSENRTIVRKGLSLIANTENLGLISIIEKAGLSDRKLTSTSIAFGIAPKINAAGRFGSPNQAVSTLLSDDEEQAEQLAETLISLNNTRRESEAQVTEEINRCIAENPQLLNERVLIFCGKGWHHGVIGIVSSKILEAYGKPNIIISLDDNGLARGSARSVKGFSIFKCFESCADLLVRFGGHECAGGITIEESKIEEFCKRVADYARSAQNIPPLTLVADKVLRSADLSLEKVESLSLLEPFGEGNPQPIFAVIGARVDRIIPLANGKHTKLELSYDSSKLSVLIFSQSPETMPFGVNDRADLLVTLEVSEYNGNKSVAVKAKDFRISGIHQERYFAAKACYEQLCRGEDISDALKERVVPSEKELDVISAYIKNLPRPENLETLFCRLSNNDMNFCKFRNSIDILDEIGAISFDRRTQQVWKKTASYEASAIYNRLKSL